MFHGFLSLIRGYDTKLSDLECKIIGDLCISVGEDKCRKLRSRIESINKITRLDGGREVLFYNERRGSVLFDPAHAISDVPGACKYAKFVINSSDKMTRNSGRIFLSQGNFASIEYRNPTEHADVCKISTIDIVIIEKAFGSR